MEQTRTIVSFDDALATYPEIHCSKRSLHVTSKVLDDLFATVGALPPETGAIGLGPLRRGGADVLEFDESGSRAASASVYAPDAVWATGRVNYWAGQPQDAMRVLTLWAHSHPGGLGRPSTNVGQGRGDLGFARALLDAFPWFGDLYLPILTGTGTNRCQLWSWRVTREAPDTPLYAPVVVCAVARFPERELDGAWLSDVGVETPINADSMVPHVPLIPVDIDEIASRAGTRLVYVSGSFGFARRDTTVTLDFSEGFPALPPEVAFHGPSGTAVPFRFRWAASRRERVELRLARLVRAAHAHAQRHF